MRAVRIGTRGSALALWQARAVAAGLQARGADAELVTITTRGDARQDAPLAALGGKGVFVAEIHHAMRRREIDIAVHSAKDMAATSPEGLVIAAVLPREDARDALVAPHSAHERLAGLGPGEIWKASGATIIGTGSPRRIAQLSGRSPLLRFEPIRGNVDTRLRKLDEGLVHLLVLACAGLRRLGLAARITSPLDVAECVPAPGQGIIAIEARADDPELRHMVAALNDPTTRSALSAEQAVVAALGGGCQLPLGVYAEVHDHEIQIRAVAASSDGARMIRGEARGQDPVATGVRLAQDLASRGAMELLHT